MFSRARAEELLVWSLPGNQGDLYVSPVLLQDYARWQSVKFDAIAGAFRQGLGMLNGNENPEAGASVPQNRGMG